MDAAAGATSSLHGERVKVVSATKWGPLPAPRKALRKPQACRPPARGALPAAGLRASPAPLDLRSRQAPAAGRPPGPAGCSTPTSGTHPAPTTPRARSLCRISVSAHAPSVLPPWRTLTDTSAPQAALVSKSARGMGPRDRGPIRTRLPVTPRQPARHSPSPLLGLTVQVALV